MAKLLEFEATKSAHIEKLTYDPDTRMLFVRFQNGGSDTYADVPPNVFAEMTRSASIGKYFHHVIRAHYRRVEHSIGGGKI